MILRLNAIPAALLAHMFPQQLPGLGIEQADEQLIPLHAHHMYRKMPGFRKSWLFLGIFGMQRLRVFGTQITISPPDRS